MKQIESVPTCCYEKELSPLEFSQDLAVLVVEGRIPELTTCGRRRGFHSWPLSNNSKKKCCVVNDSKPDTLCNLVSLTRTKVASLCEELQALCIEVLISANEEHERLDDSSNRIRLDKGHTEKPTLVVEQWTLEVSKLRDEHIETNASLLFQAVHSFLHFSQLSSWWAASAGTFPACVHYRFSADGTNTALFCTEPQGHKFPRCRISGGYIAAISVLSIPRMECSQIKSIMFDLQLFGLRGAGKKQRNRKHLDFVDCNSSDGNTAEVTSAVMSAKTANKLLSVEMLTSKESIDSSRTQSKWLLEKIQHGGIAVPAEDHKVCLNGRPHALFFGHNHAASVERIANCSQSYGPKACDFQMGLVSSPLSNRKDQVYMDTQTSVPSLEQPVSPVACSSSETFGNSYNVPQSKISGFSLADMIQSFQLEEKPKSSFEPDSTLEKDFCIHDSTEHSQVPFMKGEGPTSSDHSEEVTTATMWPHHYGVSCPACLFQNIECVHSTPPKKCKLDILLGGQANGSCFLKGKATGSVRIRSKSVSPEVLARLKVGNCSAARVLPPRQLTMVCGTVPVFHPSTGLPVSSSPAPIKKCRKISEMEYDSSVSRSGSSDESSSMGLSKSAPACTLLGNFEESMLQGRMPLYGTLEGFRAELGASGSFCPKHVRLPVRVNFFHLSDDHTPSPYLGYIRLSEKKFSKKGYHVPRKGTVQLTLFNPNKTVIKVFVILYDFTDMPASSQTFLRQKIVSLKKDANSAAATQCLHYAVHLRFISTKHERVYLHTNIRVIFPQQAPDVESTGQLQTLTDGPSDPKYTPHRCHHHDKSELQD